MSLVGLSILSQHVEALTSHHPPADPKRADLELWTLKWLCEYFCACRFRLDLRR